VDFPVRSARKAIIQILKGTFKMSQVKIAVNDNTPTFLGKLRKWIEHSGAVNALNRLDDRTLADIGLNRADINDFVRSWSKDSDAA
jgi:uncharacterized protein YjiS (DUF1127 family)